MKMRALLSLFVVTALTLLAGCTPGGGSSGDPWNRSAGPAQQAPSPLGPSSASTAVAPAYPYPGTYDYNREAQPQTGSLSDPYAAYGNIAPPAEGTMPAAAAAPGTVAPAKVAILVPLSGPHSDLGQAMLQAAQLALFDMEYNSFELVPRDTKGTPEGARAAAESAASSGAQLILGPLFAGSVRAAKPVARRHNLNMVTFSTDWTLGDDMTYVMGFLPFAQVKRITEYAADNGFRRFGIFAPDTAYGDTVINAFNTYRSAYGVGPAHTQRFSNNKTDLTEDVNNFVASIQRDGINVVLLPVGGQQMRSVGNLLTTDELDRSQVKFIGTGLWDDYTLTSERVLHGAWFASPSPDLRRSFERRYRETYSRSAPRLSTLAYDATALAVVLARNGAQRGSAPDYNRAALTNPNGFAGIDGIFRFRNDSLVERGLAVMEIKAGDIRVIDPAPRTFQGSGYYGETGSTSGQPDRYGGL